MLITLIFIILILSLFFMRLFHKIFRRHRQDHPSLSVIIPFREGDDMTRDRVFQAVFDYYTECLPEAEIIVATDPLNAYPFNKSAAINAGILASSGDVIAVVDADCYIDCNTIRECARLIEESTQAGKPLWIVPYERFYRLNKETTLDILPALNNQSVFSYLGDPPHTNNLDPSPAKHSTGHHYGALIQILPRQAFDLVEGWDVSFSGWGSEDISNLFALDTLYGQHRIFDGPVYHLWHHINFGSYEFTRTWIGQESPEQNWALANAYKEANGDETAMWNLVLDSIEVAAERNKHLEKVKDKNDCSSRRKQRLTSF